MDSNNRLGPLWTRLSRCATWNEYVTEMDRIQFQRRFNSEGIAFGAAHLAALGGNLQAGLESGSLQVTARFGLKSGTALPRFLYNAWRAIFFEDGKLRGVPDAQAVACIKQLTTVYSKLPGCYPVGAERAVIDRFKQNEANISTAWSEERLSFVPPGMKRDVRTLVHRASLKIKRLLAGIDPADIRPRHGSGASACRTLPWERYGSFRFCPLLNSVWPYDSYFFAGLNHLVDDYQSMLKADTLDRCARVMLVPKDYRGPRLISAEPRELMYIQQGLMDLLVHVCETSPGTRGFVNFTDQTINQRLAAIGSRDGSLATIDLKDASDLVRMDLVERLFPKNWVDALHAARSTRTVLPDGDEVVMHKHAPMGSAVCFPVMALVLWAITTTAISSPNVWVYGDDIIVPSAKAEVCMAALESVDLKVNRDKSFYRGPFRESCGKEYVNGIDVTPIKLKTYATDDIHDIASLVSFANNLRIVHLDASVAVTAFVKEVAPYVGEVSDSKHAFFGDELPWLTTRVVTTEPEAIKPLTLWVYRADNASLRRRWNPNLQRLEYRLRCPRGVYRKIDPDGWGYVLRFLLNGGDAGASCRVALAKRIEYKYGWIALD